MQIDYRSEDDFNGALCNKLLLTDSACFSIVDTTTVTSTGMVFFVLLILTLVSVGAGVVYCYRKKLKREMNKEIKMQVSTAVEHYFALTETSHAK
jgi:cbb3-type cytochrome oxidase subunit 3